MSDTGRATTYPPSPAPFAGFRSPTYTPVPDELFDELLSSLSGAELKVLLYIIRRTFGFKKQAERISLSQIRRGITTRDGRVLDQGTGLSLSATQAAIKGLVAKGVITLQRNRSAEKGDQATTYSLRLLGQQAPQPQQQDNGADPRAQAGDSREGGESGVNRAEGNDSKSTDGEWRTFPLRPEGTRLHNPGTENRQGGVPTIGSGGYRESATQETGSQQTEISVRNSKASRQEHHERNERDGGGGTGAATGVTTSSRSTTRPLSSAYSTGSLTSASREEEEVLLASDPTASLQQFATAFRQYPHAARGSDPRPLNHVLSARSAQLMVVAGQRPHPKPQPQQRVRDRYGRVKPTAQVAVAVTEIAQEFGDLRHLGANCTQAMRVWDTSGRSESAFVSALYEARAITKQQPRVSNRMSYFWTVVRDLVGLLDESPASPAVLNDVPATNRQATAVGDA